MDEIYFLNFQGEAIELFRSPKAFESENTLIDEMEKFDRSSRIHLVDIQLKLIFSRFDSINHRSDRWQDNLKTLLAHGFHLVRGSGRILNKSFYPVRFTLVPAGQMEVVHFGFFHKLDGQDIAERFIEFCKATEYPPGIHAHIVELVLCTCGGILTGIEPQKTTRLIQRDRDTGTITGADSIIRLLTTPGNSS